MLTGHGFLSSSSSAYAELEISRRTSFNLDLGAAFVVYYHDGLRSRSLAALASRCWLRLRCALLAWSFAAGSMCACCWLRRACALLAQLGVLAAGSGVCACCQLRLGCALRIYACWPGRLLLAWSYVLAAGSVGRVHCWVGRACSLQAQLGVLAVGSVVRADRSVVRACCWLSCLCRDEWDGCRG